MTLELSDGTVNFQKENLYNTKKNQEITKTLSSPLSPLVMRVSLSIYVTSNSPLLVSDGGLNPSGSRGSSSGGSCDKFPVVFTVVFSNDILIVASPNIIRMQICIRRIIHLYRTKNTCYEFEKPTYEFKFVG